MRHDGRMSSQKHNRGATDKQGKGMLQTKAPPPRSGWSKQPLPPPLCPSSNPLLVQTAAQAGRF
jgi:hypothetical protein